MTEDTRRSYPLSFLNLEFPISFSFILICFYNFFLPPLLVIEEKPRIGFPKILRHEEDYTSILQSIDWSKS